MSGRQRLAVLGLVLSAIVAGAALVGFASMACPTQTAAQPCPNAAFNRGVVLSLAATVAVLLVTPFAFLGELTARGRVARGAWLRAVRRGLLAGAIVAALGGLRLGEALSVPAGIFVVLLAGIVEWSAIRRFDTVSGD
jgi:hypothetical protein